MPCRAFHMQKCGVPGLGRKAWRTQGRRKRWATHALPMAGDVGGAGQA